MKYLHHWVVVRLKLENIFYSIWHILQIHPLKVVLLHCYYLRPYPSRHLAWISERISNLISTIPLPLSSQWYFKHNLNHIPPWLKTLQHFPFFLRKKIPNLYYGLTVLCDLTFCPLSWVSSLDTHSLLRSLQPHWLTLSSPGAFSHQAIPRAVSWLTGTWPSDPNLQVTSSKRVSRTLLSNCFSTISLLPLWSSLMIS